MRTRLKLFIEDDQQQDSSTESTTELPLEEFARVIAHAVTWNRFTSPGISMRSSGSTTKHIGNALNAASCSRVRRPAPKWATRRGRPLTEPHQQH